MAIRKKNTAESETVRAEDSVKTGQKSVRVRTTAAAETTGTTDNKSAKTQSPAAATHKSSARPTVKAAAAGNGAESVTVETTTFDASLHHEEISKEAYINWLRNGCPHGSEHHDWATAVEIVRVRHSK